MRILLLFLFINISFIYAQDFRYGKVSEEELSQKQHPLDPEADAAILYRDESTRFEYNQDTGFFILTEVFERVKIYNSEGYYRATKQVVLYQGNQGEEEVNSIRGVTYNLRNGDIDETKLKKDGIFKEERSKNYDILKFTMPDIQDGCVIEYKYTFKTPFLNNINEISLQDEIPLNKADVRFAVPEYFGLNKYQKGWLQIVVDEDRRDRSIPYRYRQSSGAFGGGDKTIRTKIDFIENIYKISVADVPAIKEEVYSGNINNYKSGIKFELSYTKYPGEPITPISSTWEDVSKTIYDSQAFGQELQSSRYYDEDADALLEGISSPEEKIFKVFEFVKNKMTWNRYFGMYTDEGVKAAYKKGSGNTADINLILVSMLRYAGIEANPVILSTKENGIPLFPTRNGFNYVIAAAELDGQLMLMDATNKIGEVNLLEEELLNWNGRLIKENGLSTWVGLNPKKHAEQITMLTVDLGETMQATGKVQSRLSGHKALNYRANMGRMDEEEKRKKLEEMYTGCEIYEVKMKNIETPYKPVAVSYDFESLNGVEEIDNKIYFSPLFHFAVAENPFKAEERQYPIDYTYPRKDKYIVSIELPEGYKVEQIPENAGLSLSDEMGTFQYIVSQVGTKIQLSMETSINTPLIAPQYYQDLKKFYDLIISKENEKIILSKI